MSIIVPRWARRHRNAHAHGRRAALPHNDRARDLPVVVRRCPPPWPYRYRRRPVVVDIDGGATHRETMSPGHRLFLASGTTALMKCSPSRFSSRQRFGATRRIVLPHQFEQSGPRACHLAEVHPRHEQCVDLPPLSSTPDIFTLNYLLI